jgi:hypothetical protein
LGTAAAAVVGCTVVEVAEIAEVLAGEMDAK